MDKKSPILCLYFVAISLLGAAQLPLAQGREGVGPGRHGPTSQEVPQTIFLSGRVVLEGEQALPASAQVRLICNGAVRQSVFTSQDGRFDLTLGAGTPSPDTMNSSIGSTTSPNMRSPTLSEAESRDPFRTSGTGRMMSFNRVDLSSCRCEASLPGYRAEPIVLGYRSPLDNPDVGVITMSPLNDVKGTTVSLNTLNAPDKAKEAFKKAGEELQKEEVDHGKVGQYLREAIKLFPEFAAAWQILGETELALGRKEKARECFQKAMAADPNYVTPYIALAEMEVGLNKWDEAVLLTDQAIALNPYVTRAYYFRAISKYYRQQDTEAEVALRKVLDSEDASLYPASHYLLGGILADRHSYEAAAAEFRLFLRTRPHEHLANQVSSRLQEWENQGLIKPSSEEPTPATEN